MLLFRNKGKLKGQRTIAAASPGQSKDSLFHFKVNNSGKTFLVDTGASISLFPVSQSEASSRPANHNLLISANGSPIATFGHRMIELTVGKRSFRWPFLLAKVTQPILGAGFLCHAGPLVDVRRQRLVHTASWEVTNLRMTASKRTAFAVSQRGSEHEEWLKTRSPELLTPTFSAPTVKHGVELHIPTKGRPVFARARRLPPDKLSTARAAFDQMEDAGIVRRSKSSWSSPLHLVSKDDG